MKIWLKTVTAEQLQRVEVLDWIEGYGDILSMAEVEFIRHYGNLLAKLQDNPKWDCTDGAHPAWWRGEKYSAYMAAKLVAAILNGEDIDKGTMNEPITTMRNSVLELKQERDRLFKRCEEKENKLLSKLTEELEAAKSLWIKAQKACKKHALRGDALEKENGNCWERIHNLEEENRVYHDRIEELKAEILTLQSRSDT